MSRHEGLRRLLVVVSGAVLVIVAAGCVTHPIGAARTYDDYERKATTTAESARSAVATVRLLAEAAGDGNTFGPFAAVVVSEQEDALGGLRGTFASIQPPDDRAVELRDELTPILDDAFTGVGDVRIAVRRGDLEEAARRGDALSAVSAALDAVIEAHP
ncbi:MAG: hypothetical protein ABW328_08020 [Ilumatobacteraceae bacterium]